VGGSVAGGGHALLDVGHLGGISPGLHENGNVIAASRWAEGDLIVDSSNDLLLDGDDSTKLKVLLQGKLLAGFSFGLLEHIGLNELRQLCWGDYLVSADELSEDYCQKQRENEEEFAV